MKIGRGVLVRGLALFGLSGLVLLSLAIWAGNRQVEAVSVVETRLSFQRAVAWLQANETHVLTDGNAALWWMLQTAAERTGDPYLAELVRTMVDHTYGHAVERQTPWLRMIYPESDATLNLVDIQPLLPYQRFFYHAVTCRPVDLDGGDTSRFMRGHMCRPQVFKVLARDPVCSTHQLIGLLLLRRTACPVPSDLANLEGELSADIAWQLRADVVVRDAYLQRVLTLLWVGRAAQVEPVWLRRVLASQQADGGWSGRRQFPELPNWLQPGAFDFALARWWPAWFKPPRHATDFHATAQGLLIAALSLPPKAVLRSGVALP